MTRPVRWDRIRFLAVAVLLAGMAWVTYDTQQDVNDGNEERRLLRAQVHDLQVEVKDLKAANVRKDAEIKRLNTLLISRGIDPRPAATPTVIVQVPASQTRSSSSAPAPRASSRPASRPSSSSPKPSPSPTCSTAYNPVTGQCLT